MGDNLTAMFHLSALFVKVSNWLMETPAVEIRTPPWYKSVFNPWFS